MIALVKILLPFWIAAAVSAGPILQDSQGVQEPVVVAFTASGAFQVYSINPHRTDVEVVLPLPSHTGVLPTGICRKWHCSRPSIDLICKDEVTVALTQLQNGITLAELVHNETQLWIITAILNLNSYLPHHSIQHNLFDIVYIADGYTVYVSQSGTLFACDLHPNFTNLSGSSFRCSHLSSNYPISDPSLASNMVARDDEQVLFAYNGSLYAVRYFSYRISFITSLHGALCKHLIYSSGIAYLYCDADRALTVNLDADLPEVNIHYLNDSGIPFPCHHSPNAFSVMAGTNHTQITYRGQTFRTEGVNFYDGQCVVDSQSRPLFYFIDQFSGLYVVNISSSTVSHVPEACNITNMCAGLYPFPDVGVTILRSGFPMELLVYDEDLGLLRQEKLSMEVAGVSLYIIQRTAATTANAPTTADAPTTANTPTTTSSMMTTPMFTEEATLTGRPEATTLDADAGSNFSRSKTIGIIVPTVAAVIVIIMLVFVVCCCVKGRGTSMLSIAHKVKSCYCNCQDTSNSKEMQGSTKLKPVAQESSQNNDPSNLVPGIQCNRPGGSAEQVISAQRQSYYNSISSQPSSSSSPQPSDLQRLKADDAKYGYPETVPVSPCNAEK